MATVFNDHNVKAQGTGTIQSKTSRNRISKQMNKEGEEREE